MAVGALTPSLTATLDVHAAAVLVANMLAAWLNGSHYPVLLLSIRSRFGL